MRLYEYLRTRPGIPWDAPRAWFVSDEAYEAWQARRPLRLHQGSGAARKRLKATRTQRERALARGGYRCAFCGTDRTLTVDHLVPVVFGGNNHPNNQRILCERDNREHFQRFYGGLDSVVAEAA